MGGCGIIQLIEELITVKWKLIRNISHVSLIFFEECKRPIVDSICHSPEIQSMIVIMAPPFIWLAINSHIPVVWVVVLQKCLNSLLSHILHNFLYLVCIYTAQGTMWTVGQSITFTNHPFCICLDCRRKNQTHKLIAVRQWC